MSLANYQACYSCAYYGNNVTSHPCDVRVYSSPVEYISGSFPSSGESVTMRYQLQIDLMPLEVKNVIFNYPATVVFWADGTKTVVKCAEQDKYDAEKGLAMAICKKVLGKDFHRVFKENCKNASEDQETVSEVNEWCRRVEESFTHVSKFLSMKGENKNEA